MMKSQRSEVTRQASFGTVFAGSKKGVGLLFIGIIVVIVIIVAVGLIGFKMGYNDTFLNSKNSLNDDTSILDGNTQKEVNQDSKVSNLSSEKRGAFISTWNTSLGGPFAKNNNSQITLPLESSGIYNFEVNWGDGTKNTITSWNQSEVTHDYPVPGVYTIEITGQIIGWNFGNTPTHFNGNDKKIIGISQWGVLKLGNGGSYFRWCSNLDISAIDVLDLTETTNLKLMFSSADSLTNPNFSNWDVHNVTNMAGMFSGAETFNGNVSNWNVTSVTNMNGMFSYASNFNGDLSSWDTGSVTDMSNMFHKAHVFNQDISSWDVSSVIDMSNMFEGLINNFNQDLSSWKVDNVLTCENFYSRSWTEPKPNFSSCTP